MTLLAVGCGRAVDNRPMACTQEAKLCPDGSYVGRTGADCQFAACPASTATATPPEPVTPPIVPPTKSGAINGYIHMGPVCPVQRIPPDPNCTDKPYTKAAVSVISSNGKQYQTQSDSAGKFNLSVPVGSYTVKVASPNSLPRCASQTVTVTANNPVNIDISCDTGIR